MGPIAAFDGCLGDNGEFITTPPRTTFLITLTEWKGVPKSVNLGKLEFVRVTRPNQVKWKCDGTESTKSIRHRGRIDLVDGRDAREPPRPREVPYLPRPIDGGVQNLP